jgi:hypothetical protein
MPTRSPRRGNQKVASETEPQQVIVRLRDTGAANASIRAVLDGTSGEEPSLPLDAVLHLHEGITGRPLFSAPAATEELRQGSLRHRRLTWVLPDETSAGRHPHPTLNLLELPTGVKARGVVRMLNADPRIAYAHVPAPRTALEAVDGPGDPAISRQWALEQCGFPDAWNYTDPIWGAPVPVGLVDSGIDVGHEDLQTCTRLVTFGSGADDRTGHGTRVAGVLAAVRGNHVGISGGARCALEVFKVFTPAYAPQNYYSALQLLATSAVRVINISLGGTIDDPTERALIHQCIAAGKIIVAPMGNTSDFSPGTPVFPAAYESEPIIAVGSTDTHDAHADFSITGDHIWLSAPGTQIWTTARVEEGSYDWVNGTSFSTPLVAAACALMCRRWPDLDAAAARMNLTQLVSPVDGLLGWHHTAGYGRLDLRRLRTL